MGVKDFLDGLLSGSNKIPSQNLELMESVEEDGMGYLLARESMGGNAPRHKGYNLVVANFVFDDNQGKILRFSNKRAGISAKQLGSFEVAFLDYLKMVALGISEPRSIFFKIVNVYLPAEIGGIAKSNIEKSVALYNDKYRIDKINI